MILSSKIENVKMRRGFGMGFFLDLDPHPEIPEIFDSKIP